MSTELVEPVFTLTARRFFPFLRRTLATWFQMLKGYSTFPRDMVSKTFSPFT